MSKVKSSARAPRLLKFIMLVSFSETLLAVSILDMIDICGCFCSRKWVNNKYCNVAHSRLLGSLWDLSKAERFLLPWFRMAVSFIQSLLACGFDFKHSIWLLFVATFAALKGFITVPVETMGHFQPWDNPFQNVGEFMGSSQSWKLRTHLRLAFPD